MRPTPAGVRHHVVTVGSDERDRYKRVLGHVLLNDRWINREMIAEGWPGTSSGYIT